MEANSSTAGSSAQSTLTASSAVRGSFSSLRARWLSLFAPALVLAVLLPTFWLALRWQEARLIADKRAVVAGQLNSYAQSVTRRLDKHFSLLESLRAFATIDEVKVVATEEKADAFFGKLIGNFEAVRSMAVAPGGVTRWTYPKASVAFEVGTDMLKEDRPEVAADVESAMRTYQPSVSTAEDLRWSSPSWIAWLAVEHDYAFWGLVALELDIGHILGDVGPYRRPGGWELAMRDEAGRVIYGTRATFEGEPVISRIELANGFWELAAIPTGNWTGSVRGSQSLFQLAGLIAITLVTALAYAAASTRSQLALVARERAGIAPQLRIETSETQRGVLNELDSRVGMAYRCRNLRDRPMDYVGEGCTQLTGYSPSEMLAGDQATYAKLIHPDDEKRVWNEIQSAVRADRVFQCLYRVATRKGEVKWVMETGRAVAGRSGDQASLECFVTCLATQPPQVLDVSPSAATPRAKPPLTDREREVLQLLAKGFSNQQIADMLVISERTVRNHVSSILLKLNLESRTQAALYAVQEGAAR